MERYSAQMETEAGPLLLQCTDAGITCISFREPEAGMQFQEHPLLEQCRQELNEYFSGRRTVFTLPLELQGTPFQVQVWQLLLQIPFGKTLSYQALSRQFGDLKAIRAVASANGRNDIAIVVPCHRVIGSDGSLTGYAGGLWRKRWLLAHEAKWHCGVQVLF
ncbi:MAG TPA: methylated-DNA--[protein]-cysteine S-methyltransferase [Chitinophagaceae bacterium]|jgi:methylated-DNA-[protein]-cysteine S-methyltransferase|nr:methylated-DNA--[protein]-cysteine S-methyltransferase [Chitinophagaceae bacterium]